jgi:purine nucleosidase
VGLGAATDIASAVLKAPEIIDHIIVFWHFRTHWPEKCYNFNVIGDVRAARLVFHLPIPVVLFDTGTYLRCPMEESATYVAPYGALGAYLHGYRTADPSFIDPKKGFFDLGDIAALLDPDIACWDITSCPEVDWDLSYRFRDTLGFIQRCYHVDRDATFGHLYHKLASAYG